MYKHILPLTIIFSVFYETLRLFPPVCSHLSVQNAVIKIAIK